MIDFSYSAVVKKTLSTMTAAILHLKISLRYPAAEKRPPGSPACAHQHARNMALRAPALQDESAQAPGAVATASPPEGTSGTACSKSFS